MDFTISFEQLPSYALLTTSGPASVDGLREAFSQLVNDPQWVKGMALIVDHRDLEMSRLSQQSMRAIKRMVVEGKELLGEGPCAYVVKDDLGVGLTRQFQSLEAKDVHGGMDVFRTLGEAVAWLGSLRGAP